MYGVIDPCPYIGVTPGKQAMNQNFSRKKNHVIQLLIDGQWVTKSKPVTELQAIRLMLEFFRWEFDMCRARVEKI